MEQPLRRRNVLLQRLMVLSGVALAANELWRIAITAPLGASLVAAALTAVWLPLHLRHLRAGVLGHRPAGWSWSFALLVASQVVGAELLGPSWALMLSAVAVSALVLLRPLPAALVLLGCVGYGASLGLGQPSGAVVASHPAYLGAAILLRTVLQFSIVWLVSASERLSALQDEAVEGAVEDRRERVRVAISERLTDQLDQLTTASRAFLRHRPPSGVAPARARTLLLSVSDAARALLVEVRHLSGDLRAEVLEPGGPANRVRTLSGTGAPASAKRFHAAVDVVAVGFALVLGLGAAGPVPSAIPRPAVVLLGVVALVAYRTISSAYAAGRLQRGHSSALAVVLVVAAAYPLVGWSWYPVLWAVAAAVWLLLGVRAGVVCALLAVPLTYWRTVMQASDPPTSVPDVVFNAAYHGTSTLLVIVALVAAADLVRLMGRQQAFEVWLTARARRTEQQRLAAQLHDLLGQGLTGLALRCDLADRLIDRDPGNAADEVAVVAELVDQQLAVLNRLVEVEVRISVRDEIASARRLLGDLGIQIETVVAPGPLPAALDRLLGWTVREATANVLRHSVASSCTIRLEAQDAQWTLTVVNDGVDGSAGPAGNGLSSLRERFHELGGTLRSRSSSPTFSIEGRLGSTPASRSGAAGVGAQAPRA